MKAGILFLLLVGFVVADDIWTSEFSGTDTQKLNALQNGVLLARYHFAGDECLAKHFGTGATAAPSDAATNQRWSAWLCSYWNPNFANSSIITTDDCAYPGVGTLTEARIAMNLLHNAYPPGSDAEFDRVADILVRSIELFGGYGNTFITNAKADLEGVRASIVDSAVQNDPCTTSAATVNWVNPVDVSVNIDVGDQVSFVWGSGLHGVATDEPTLQLLGFGSANFPLSSGDACDNTDPTVPCDILGNTDYVYAKQFLSAGSYDCYCVIHDTTMLVTVNVGLTSSSSSDISTGSDGDEGTDGSSACTLTPFFL